MCAVLLVGCGLAEQARLPAPQADDAPVESGHEPQVAALLWRGAHQVQLAVSGGFSVEGSGGEALLRHSGPEALKVVIEPSSDGQVLNGVKLAHDSIFVVPDRDGTVEVEGSGYRGIVQVLRTDVNKLDVVNLVGVESYLASVLGGELYSDWLLTTFQAQCVAARTYALNRKYNQRSSGHWDVLVTQGDQVYKGMVKESDRSRQAVEDTRGIVLVYGEPGKERIFSSYYSAHCGGTTQSVVNLKDEPEIPPLAGGVPSPASDLVERPNGNWGPLQLSKSFITDQLRARYEKFKKIGPVTSIKLFAQTKHGRVIKLQINDAEGKNLTLRGEDFRNAVNRGLRASKSIRSSIYKLRDRGNEFEFSQGRGFGHGVGLCQAGAEGMAREGSGAVDILTHYYPRAQLVRAY